MCGVAACVLDRDDAPAASAVVGRMLRAMAHRGPDQVTGRSAGPAPFDAHLGVARLAVTDPSPRAAQPMTGAGGDVLTAMNGEIYDWRAHRDRLRMALRTECDAEVLPHLYEHHGVRFPEQVDGMYAAVVLDRRRRRVVLARDPMGEKPLHYVLRPGCLLIASDLPGLLASGMVPHDVDEQSVVEFMAFRHVPGAHTALRAVRRVPPGCRVTVDLTTWNACVERHHLPDLWRSSPHDTADTADAAEELEAALDTAVRSRATVPDVDAIGVTLSGGIDSGLVATTARRHVGDLPMHACSVGVDADPEDGNAVRTVATLAGMHRHTAACGTDDVRLLPDVVAAMGEPIGAGMIVPSWRAYRLAGRHCRVVLSGEGADELFAGYGGRLAVDAILRDPDAAHRAAPRDPQLRAALQRAGTDPPPDEPIDRYLWWNDDNCYPETARQSLLAGSVVRGDPVARLRHLDRYSVGARPENRMLWLETQLRLDSFMLAIVDRAAMASSVESRAPFLHPAVVDLAYRTPVEHKRRDGIGKYLLRRAAARTGLLPGSTVWAPKHPFAGPIASWMAALPPSMEKVLLANDVGGVAPFDDDRLRGALDEVGRGVAAPDVAAMLFGALVLGMWYRIVVQGAGVEEFR